VAGVHPSDPDAECGADAGVRPGDQAGSGAGASAGPVRAFAESVGLVPPRGEADPYAHRRGEPRGFTVLWLAYLFLVAGVVYAAIGNPAFASAEGYRLASKVLLTMVGVGLLTVWPLLRLTQGSPIAGGVSATSRDIAIVLIPMQALIWPQSLITGWSVASVAAIAVVLVAWTLIVGAIVAIAIGPARGHPRTVGSLNASRHEISSIGRAAAMLAVLGLGAAGPLAALLLPPAETEIRALFAMCSPLSAPWELFADRSWMGRRAVTLPEHWKPVLLTLVVGLVAWALLLVSRRSARVEDEAASA
jgi:hypothetical protein